MIYVFKTSVSKELTVLQLAPFLNGALPDARWSIDWEDCDHVLRVDSPLRTPEPIVRILQQKGFYCEELD